VTLDKESEAGVEGLMLVPTESEDGQVAYRRVGMFHKVTIGEFEGLEKETIVIV
jgi:hypothetical protein